MSNSVEVSTVSELLGAASDKGSRTILVSTELLNAPTIRLQPGASLKGVGTRPSIYFAPGADGVVLSQDNLVENMRLVCDVDRCAITNDTSYATLGRQELIELALQGCLRILARDAVRAGHIEAEDIVIEAADATGFGERPKGYGVEVVPGAFTIWNQHADPSVTITANLVGVSAGQEGQPVKGSGVFVSGGGETGGRLVISRLETGVVCSDGGIAAGTADRISGGVFTVHGTFVDSVNNAGPVTTFGPNDMVLDNWGMIGEWTAERKVTSFGPSAIGFVNFGTIRRLEVNGPIETFGHGARAFNVYDGTVLSAEFEQLTTHGDGAVGVQISRPIGELLVRQGIETFGRTGDSLVKGVIAKLSAIPLSVKKGGSARSIEVLGGLSAHGENIPAIELEGSVETLIVRQGS